MWNRVSYTDRRIQVEGFWKQDAVKGTGPKRGSEKRLAETAEGFTVCSSNKIINQVEKENLGRTCYTYGREKQCTCAFGCETWRKETTWKTYVQISG